MPAAGGDGGACVRLHAIGRLCPSGSQPQRGVTYQPRALPWVTVTPPDQGKLLVFHGTADANITMDQFAALAIELEKQHVSHEMITYGGAPHAFTVFGSDGYREDADRASWRRFTEFLAETLQ
jgi:dienelactone hydrolase